jgi:hypothetical protein
MECAFCGEEGALVRRLAPTSVAASLARTEALELCRDCYEDLLEVTTPLRADHDD